MAVDVRLSKMDFTEQGMSRVQSQYQRHSGSGNVSQKYKENIKHKVHPKMQLDERGNT